MSEAEADKCEHPFQNDERPRCVQAAGLAGYCLKNCATDADCVGLNAYCSENAGTGQKTCQIGKRPCVTNAHCPSPQTCFGATATAVGYCG